MKRSHESNEQTRDYLIKIADGVGNGLVNLTHLVPIIVASDYRTILQKASLRFSINDMSE